MYLKNNHNGAILVEDETGEKRLDVLQGLIRQMAIPSNWFRKLLRTKKEKDLSYLALITMKKLLLRKK